MERQQVDICGFHHASLLVSDLERSLHFWCEVLGLSIDHQRPDLGFNGAWLELGDGGGLHLLQLPNPDPVSGRPAHAGRDRHLALRVAELEPLCQRLEEAGIAFSRSRSGRAALFCRDPDGNGVELIAAISGAPSSPCHHQSSD
jgi:glyoxylase I family protein